MHTTEKQILQLQSKIQQGKLKVLQAIRDGAIFDEVKIMSLSIKELEKKLEILQNRLHTDGLEKSQK